jgi:hypothetical protein
MSFLNIQGVDKKVAAHKKRYILFFATINKESHNKFMFLNLFSFVYVWIKLICDFKSRIRKNRYV